jgi:hypothetical protein
MPPSHPLRKIWKTHPHRRPRFPHLPQHYRLFNEDSPTDSAGEAFFVALEFPGRCAGPTWCSAPSRARTAG